MFFQDKDSNEGPVNARRSRKRGGGGTPSGPGSNAPKHPGRKPLLAMYGFSTALASCGKNLIRQHTRTGPLKNSRTPGPGSLEPAPSQDQEGDTLLASKTSSLITGTTRSLKGLFKSRPPGPRVWRHRESQACRFQSQCWGFGSPESSLL